MFNTNTKRNEPEDSDKELALPDIVPASEVNWPANMRRIGKYGKYDNIKVGEAILGLERQMSETIRQRLKKRGYKVEACAMADGTFALRRVEDEGTK